MTADDVEAGSWWNAEVGSDGCFYCPKCDSRSPASEWKEVEPYCEECGSHDGRECPECGEWFDHVWGDSQIDGTIETKTWKSEEYRI